MAGRKRPSSERHRLETRARALRAQGLTAVEISRAVGVPASTLARWAAETGWRQEDLAARAETAREAEAAGEDGDGASARGSGARRGRDAERGEEALPPDALSDDAEPLTPDETARRALRRSLQLAEAGQMAAAERMARLAERMARLAAHPALQPAPEAGEAESEAAAGTEAALPFDTTAWTEMTPLQKDPRFKLVEKLNQFIAEAAIEGRFPRPGASAAQHGGNRYQQIAVGLVPLNPSPLDVRLALSSREDLIALGLLDEDFHQADEPPQARAIYEAHAEKLGWASDAVKQARSG